MKLISYVFLAFIFLTAACESSKYSDEEEAKLEEAQKLHNEALAIFADTKELLAEITETRSDLIKRHGLSGGEADTLNQASGTDTTSSSNANTARDTTNNQQQSQEQGQLADSLNADAQKALDDLNKAHGELMSWMREIYGVPNMAGGYDDDQKAKDDRSIGQDPNSAMLSTEIEVKPMPDSAGVDEILEKQKEQKEEIERIREDIKMAIKNAKGQ